MLILWRQEDPVLGFPGHIQGLATDYAKAREMVEGLSNVMATDVEVDEAFAAIEDEGLDENPNCWIRLTDAHGNWVQF